jgi:hypothetical protein
MNPNHHSRIAEILKRYIQGVPLTDEEVKLLGTFIYEKGQMDNHPTPDHGDEMAGPADEPEEMWKPMMDWKTEPETMGAEAGRKVPDAGPVRKRIIRIDRMHVAATVAAVFITVTLLVLNHSPGDEPPPLPPALKIGDHDAFLIKPNGTWIKMDSLPMNAFIPGTGNYRVQKTEANLLIFDRHGDPDDSPSGDAGESFVVGKLHPPLVLRLADGSQVCLGPGSQFSFSLKGLSVDQVYALNGNAYLRIAPHPARPVQVSLPDGNVIHVLGTDFCADAPPVDSPEIKPARVALINGKLLLKNEECEVVLHPGQVAHMTPWGFTTQNQLDSSEELRWTGKALFFQFHHTPIQTALYQIASWYNVTVYWTDSVPKILLDAPLLRTQPLEYNLDVLQQLLRDQGISLKQVGNRIIASTKK